MGIKALFYDFDGVIKDSTNIKTLAFHKLYEAYGVEVTRKVTQHHIENGGVSRFEKFKIYHKEFMGIDLTEAEIQELAKQFSEIALQEVINCGYVDGAVNSIKKLSDRYLQFIVTGTPQEEIEYILKELELAYYFEGIFGSPKDKITISQLILNEFGLHPSEVVFIGDALTDYNAAKHHQFKFILREHDENIDLFENIDVIKTKDLITLEQLVVQ